MKHCIIIPGKPSKGEYYSPDFPSPSNHHWFPWVQKQLCVKGILTQVLEMPRPYAPVYDEWKKQLDIYFLDETYTLVGHSCGGGFLLRYLSERQVNVNKLVLVAPWLDPIKGLTGDFFTFEFDKELVTRTSESHLMYSTDDEPSIQESVAIVKRWYPQVVVHEFANKGHFTMEGVETQEFPELLEIIVGT
jgi:predicted alpha/beta hydrolase family esterase